MSTPRYEDPYDERNPRPPRREPRTRLHHDTIIHKQEADPQQPPTLPEPPPLRCFSVKKQGRPDVVVNAHGYKVSRGVLTFGTIELKLVGPMQVAIVEMWTHSFNARIWDEVVEHVEARNKGMVS